MCFRVYVCTYARMRVCRAVAVGLRASVCGSGGGGGGWATAACEYGSGFNVSFSSAVIPLPKPHDRPEVAASKRRALLGDLPPAICSSDPQDSATAGAVASCTWAGGWGHVSCLCWKEGCLFVWLVFFLGFCVGGGGGDGGGGGGRDGGGCTCVVVMGCQRLWL